MVEQAKPGDPPSWFIEEVGLMKHGPHILAMHRDISIKEGIMNAYF